MFCCSFVGDHKNSGWLVNLSLADGVSFEDSNPAEEDLVRQGVNLVANMTVKAIFWPWTAGRGPSNALICSRVCHRHGWRSSASRSSIHILFTCRAHVFTLFVGGWRLVRNCQSLLRRTWYAPKYLHIFPEMGHPGFSPRRGLKPV